MKYKLFNIIPLYSFILPAATRNTSNHYNAKRIRRRPATTALCRVIAHTPPCCPQTTRPSHPSLRVRTREEAPHVHDRVSRAPATSRDTLQCKRVLIFTRKVVVNMGIVAQWPPQVPSTRITANRRVGAALGTPALTCRSNRRVGAALGTPAATFTARDPAPMPTTTTANTQTVARLLPQHPGEMVITASHHHHLKITTVSCSTLHRLIHRHRRGSIVTFVDMVVIVMTVGVGTPRLLRRSPHNLPHHPDRTVFPVSS